MIESVLVGVAIVMVGAGGVWFGWWLCSTTQSDRLVATQAVAEVTERASEQVLTGAKTFSDLGPRIQAMTDTMKAQVDATARLADNLAATASATKAVQGALMEAGIISRPDGYRGGVDMRMRGEAERARQGPPPLDGFAGTGDELLR